MSVATLGAAVPVSWAVPGSDEWLELREHCREPSCGCDIGRAADYAETRLRRLRDD